MLRIRGTPAADTIGLKPGGSSLLADGPLEVTVGGETKSVTGFRGSSSPPAGGTTP